MARSDGTGPRGQGPITGKPMRQGTGGRYRSSGADTGEYCSCLKCGERLPYQIGVSCFDVKCPKCGSLMTKESKIEMQNPKEKRKCAFCGYTAFAKFVGDICPNCGLTYWKCNKCGFTITTAIPPDVCRECGERCNFVNITCYTPECGGPGNIDPRL